MSAPILQRSYGTYSHCDLVSDSEDDCELSADMKLAYSMVDCDSGDPFWGDFQASRSSATPKMTAQAKSLHRRRAWQGKSSELFLASVLHTFAAYDLPCVVCKKEVKDMVRCRDCDGPMKGCQTRFCQPCFRSYHSYANQHHMPEVYMDNTWRYVTLTDNCLQLRASTVADVYRTLPDHCHTSCNSARQRRHCLVYFLNPPHQDSCFTLQYSTCSCHVAETLVGLGIMPLSPSQPTVGITLHTMHTLFQLRYGPAAVELNGLLHLLLGPDRLQHRSVRNLFSEAFVAFSDIFINSNRSMHDLGVDLPRNVQCLPCRERTNSKEPLVGVAIDLQYLGRLDISDDSFETGIDDQFAGTLLSEKQITELHSKVVGQIGSVDEEEKKKKKRNKLPPLSKSGCERHFKASDSLNGKLHHNLKERGFVAAVCADEVCLHAFESVRHEAFIHIAMMVWLLTQGLGQSKAKAEYGILVLFYDVACKISAYLNHFFPGAMQMIHFFAVGLFHIWAHVPACQRAFSGIRTKLAGLVDGELAERFFAVTAKFRNSVKYMRKATWWNTLKQTIEETNYNKMKDCVKFNIEKILSHRRNLVLKEAQYSHNLEEFMSSEEGRGVTLAQIDGYYAEDISFKDKNPDIPSHTALIEYGDLVLDYYDKERLLTETKRTSELYISLKDAVGDINTKLLKREKNPPADLTQFLSDGRPTPLNRDSWYEFVHAWGDDKLQYLGWSILIQRRQIMSQRKERKSVHLHMSSASRPRKQENNTQYQKNLNKAKDLLVKQCKHWNAVLARVRELDIPDLEATFGCSPIDVSRLDKDIDSLFQSLGSQFAQLDDRIPRHLLQYPVLKPLFDLRRDIERSNEDIVIRQRNLDLIVIARERDKKAIEHAMSRFIPPPHSRSHHNRVVQAKYSFLRSKQEELQSVISQETTLISAFRSCASSKLPASKRKRKSKSCVVSELFGSVAIG